MMGHRLSRVLKALGSGTCYLHMGSVLSVSWRCIMHWYEEGTQVAHQRELEQRVVQTRWSHVPAQL